MCRSQVFGAVDGFSRRILRLDLYNAKSATNVYYGSYLPAVTRFGIPDQLIHDQGKENILASFAQQYFVRLLCPDAVLADDAVKPSRAVRSVFNIPIERRWREVNTYFKEPVKARH